MIRIIWTLLKLARFALDLFFGLAGGKTWGGRLPPIPAKNWWRVLTTYTFEPRFSMIFWWPFFIFAVIRGLRATTPPRASLLPRPPVGFPPDIPTYPSPVRNFDHGWEVNPIWHAVPWDGEQLIEIVNWAAATCWRVRPLGGNHSWAPLGAGPDATHKTIVIDLRRFRKPLDLDGDIATFGAATTLEEASAFLLVKHRALPWSIAAGEVSIGGALAIGGHGTGTDENALPGCTMTALVDSFKALVYNATAAAYEVKSFNRRTHPVEFPALLLTLGSLIVLEVSFKTVPEYNLRHRIDGFNVGKYCDAVLAAELASDPPPRIELMWMPHQGLLRGTTFLRLIRRSWAREEPGSVEVDEKEPYRDPLVNFAAAATDRAVRKAFHDARPARTDPVSVGYRMQTALWASTLAGEKLCDAHAGNLYASHFILHFHAAGWCVIVRREKLGAALKAVAFRLQLLSDQKFRPLNGPIEVRFTKLDPRGEVALSPALCPPDEDPDDFYAMWISGLTDLRDPAAGQLLHEFESWLLEPARSEEGIVGVRPEWSKGAAYSPDGCPWSDPDGVAYFREEYGDAIGDVRELLDRYDPQQLFRSTLARRVLQ